MVWAQLETVAQDLKGFSAHAGRQGITVKDVMLLTRRNEGLEAVLKGYLEEMKAERGDDEGEEEEEEDEERRPAKKKKVAKRTNRRTAK
jgi:hypothetical protein